PGHRRGRHGLLGPSALRRRDPDPGAAGPRGGRRAVPQVLHQLAVRPRPGHAALRLRQPPGRDGRDAADARHEQYMRPGYEGYLNQAVPTMAELLRDNGYHTYLAGKWHVGIAQDTRPAARGFERSYAFLGGGASHFADARPLSPHEA